VSLFSDITAPAITPLRVGKELHPIGLDRSSLASLSELQKSTLEILGSRGDLPLDASATNLNDQFIVFQLSSSSDGPTILDSSEVLPSLDGSNEEPDVLIAAEMVSFHVARNEGLEADTRATLRMNFGKDQSSTDKRFDTVFWSIAAGLDLYDQVKKKPTEPTELKSDFQQAFSRRPIEIPGGLGRVTFDVIKHKEPPWWKHIFSFAQSGTARALISTLGFPAVTNQVIRVVDQLLEKLEGPPQILFKGFPMRLAFSGYARDAYTGGSQRVRVGSLNRGFAIFARGRDFETVAKSNAIYLPAYDRLAPADVKPGDLVSGKYDDPLENVTYAVFRLGTKRTKLDPTFQYGP
jgi:hypothetical protein